MVKACHNVIPRRSRSCVRYGSVLFAKCLIRKVSELVQAANNSSNLDSLSTPVLDVTAVSNACGLRAMIQQIKLAS